MSSDKSRIIQKISQEPTARENRIKDTVQINYKIKENLNIKDTKYKNQRYPRWSDDHKNEKYRVIIWNIRCWKGRSIVKETVSGPELRELVGI